MLEHNTRPRWKVVSFIHAYIGKNNVIINNATNIYLSFLGIDDGFFINVNIIREDLKQEISAVDYARANINLSSQNLTDYTKIQEAQIDLGGMPTLIHIFQARLNPTEKLIRFVQLYGTKGNYGYIVSGGMLPSTPKELRDLVGAVVTSFRLR